MNMLSKNHHRGWSRRILRGRATTLSYGVVVLSTLVANRAAAEQNPGFTLSRFSPAEAGSQWFTADSLDLTGQKDVSVRFVGDYAYKPLVLYNLTDGSEKVAVVRHQMVGHLGAASTFFNRLRVGANLPLVLVGRGTPGTIGGTTYAPGQSGAIGDLRLTADVRVAGQYGDRFTAALGGRVYLPTGNREAYAGDGNVALDAHALAAGTVGYFTYAARLGYTFRETTPVDRGTVGSELDVALAAGVRLLDGAWFIGPEATMATRASSEDIFTRVGTPAEVMLGTHYDANASWRFGLAGGTGLSRGFGSPVARVLATIEWAPGRSAPADVDGDGIPDSEDACKEVKGVRSCDAATHGCPLPADKDKDGILDAADACVDVPGIASGDPKAHGCPLPPDKDKDGILDAVDACVDVPGIASSDPKAHGCPPPADKDKDGIVDAVDACVDVPGVASNDAAKNGCPLPADTDKDAIVDPVDACPTEAGAANADPKRHGCPVGAVIDGQLVLDQIQFETDKDVILKVSDETLQTVLSAINALPKANRYRVEGHTDNQGSTQWNKDLSKRRATAVVRWMVGHGLTAARFDAAGFGPDRPVAPNDNDENRRKNRRVEIHIVDGGTNKTPAKAVEPAKK